MRLLSAAEQVAAHLRGEASRGGLGQRMPGIHHLAAELRVNHKTVAAAIRILEKEGLLVPQGTGRSRKIAPRRGPKPTGLRLGILMGEPADRRLEYMLGLQHELVEAGHTVVYPPKSMVELGMNVRRIAAMVRKTPVDGWVVAAGSFELLSWFATRDEPTFALFGRRRQFRMAGAGPDKPLAMAAATRRLLALGHRRIVLLARARRRLPHPGAAEQAFLDELTAHGIEATSYHLPDWEVSVDGFHRRLEALFQVTPPTALIVDEVGFFVSVMQFCGNHGLRVPEDVSLVCTDASPDFAWCRPSIAHIRWDSGPVVRRILRWAANVSRGREDVGQTFTPAEFVEGGTIGPRISESHPLHGGDRK